MGATLESYKAKDRELAQELAQAFAKAVNSMSFDREAFAEAIGREHRTIQQNTMNAFLACIARWASLDENRYDLRNEATVKASKKIMEALDNISKLPFI